MSVEPMMTRDEYARRLVRARNWHLFQAGRTRIARYALVDEEIVHEQEAQRLADQLAELGVETQPYPPGPRAIP